MINSLTGWSLGAFGLYRTVDGGINWTLTQNDFWSNTELFQFHFFDEQHGVAVGNSYMILQTSDGGWSWKLLKNWGLI